MSGQGGYPPTPSDTSGSRSSSSEYEFEAKRKRIEDDRSAESTSPQLPDTSLVQEGFTLQEFRVGCPSLHILPLDSTPIPGDSQVATSVQAKYGVFTFTLVQSGIQLAESGCFEFVYRTIEDRAPAPERMTLVVKGVRVDGCSQTWLDATDKLRVGLRMNPVTENVRVEIISWQLTRPRFTEALEQEHTIVEKWPRIRPQIHHHLDQKQVVKDHWLTIIVLRRGYIALESWYEYDDSSPTTSVVLLIIMSYDVDPWQWFAQENSIRKVLDQEGLSMVGVEFERGTNSPAAFALRSPTDDAKTADVIEKPYSVSIGLGADCGPARDFEQSPGTLIPGPCGTFGGWVWVTFPDGKKKKMLMTNFYVARDVLKGVSSSTAPDGIKPTRVDAPQGSEVDFIDRNGMKVDYQDRQHMLLEAPSRRKHIYTMYDFAGRIEYEQARIDASKNPAAVPTYQANLTNIRARYTYNKQFFDNNKQNVGRLWLASGYMNRTGYGSRLVWALVEIGEKERIGSNRVPPREDWPKPESVPGATGLNLKGLASCNDIERQGEVYKIGARSGLSRGKYSALKADVKLTHDAHLGVPRSTEHCFVYYGSRVDQPFSEERDSRGFVWTADERLLIGQLHAGPKAETLRAESQIYATDAVGLFTEMNEFPGEGYKIEPALD